MSANTGAKKKVAIYSTSSITSRLFAFSVMFDSETFLQMTKKERILILASTYHLIGYHL